MWNFCNTCTPYILASKKDKRHAASLFSQLSLACSILHRPEPESRTWRKAREGVQKKPSTLFVRERLVVLLTKPLSRRWRKKLPVWSSDNNRWNNFGSSKRNPWRVTPSLSRNRRDIDISALSKLPTYSNASPIENQTKQALSDKFSFTISFQSIPFLDQCKYLGNCATTPPLIQH